MDAPLIEIELVFSPSPGQVVRRSLRVLSGTLVREALVEAGVDLEDLQVRQGLQALGIWGRRVTLETPLRDRDRIEIYRPLTVDPKEARRQRYRGQRTARVVKG